MIRLISSVVSFAWNSLSTQSKPVLASNNDFNNVEETKEEEEEIKPSERISSFGRITSVHDEYGIIDGHIYFHFSTVLSGRVPHEGDRVLVTAFSQGIEQGFVAKSVQIMSECWEEGEEENDEDRFVLDQPRIGRVADIRDGRLYVNDDVVLNINDLKFKGFSLNVGDWITLKRCENEEDDSDGKTTEVAPLRTRPFSGQVTALESEFGVVEEQAFFKLSDCEGDYRPTVGDLVHGITIENSLTEKHDWRFIHFSPVFTSEVLELKKRAKIRVHNLAELVQDKNGVTVTSPLDFGCVLVGERKYITAWIHNGGSEDQMLTNCAFSDNAALQFGVSAPAFDKESVGVEGDTSTDDKQGTVLISPGMKAYVNIMCNAKFLGKARELLVFHFESFSIGRNVFTHVKDPKHGMLSSVQCVPNGCKNVGTKSSSCSGNDCNANTWLLPGRRLQKKTVNLPVQVPKYIVPKDLKRYCDDVPLLLQHLPFLEKELSMENYKQKLSNLLHLEEIKLSEDMKQFDMERVCMTEIGEFLALEVPGLAEGRPSVLIGDSVVASDPDDENELHFEGCIHEVRVSQLFLKFHEEFHNRFGGKDYNITFRLSRTSLRRCHLAISLWRQIGRDVLFPKKTNTSNICVFRFDERLVCNRRLNDRQLQAVRCIVEGRGRPAPYIIYGPPGTGKTVTLVEAALQVYFQQTGSRILICAPSNSAADLVCDRLHNSFKVKPTDMVRLNACYRSYDKLPEPVSLYSGSCLDLRVILRYRIIISTCVTSGMLYGLGVKPGHFTHVFIDEAGQATEPEAMISICLAAVTGSNDGMGEPFQIILAGDPQQLGPVLMSRVSVKYGLQLSLLERLSLCPLYCRDSSFHEGYNPCYVTKLINNYRSHPDLLRLPSRLFYDSELIAKADPTIANSLCGWKHLPNSTFPVLFHGIRGDDLQEMDSPSWFNAEEVFRIVCYLQSLYCDLYLTPCDVGIVAPYRKQVEKLRLLIDSVGIEMPKIGSVEEFQGQERTAIIVSTVRSTEQWVSFDKSHNLGFIFNTKRFNVTLTRAKSLLVVVGNPFVLMEDTNWRQFLCYCLTNNAYVGCEEVELRELLFGDDSSSVTA